LFIDESNFNVINECLSTSIEAKLASKIKTETTPGLMPDLLALCTVSKKEQACLGSIKEAQEVVHDLDLEGLDDDEINGYILTENEAVLKDRLWNKMNAEYIKSVKEREEKAAREQEEGKPEKKKRRSRKKPIGLSLNFLNFHLHNISLILIVSFHPSQVLASLLAKRLKRCFKRKRSHPRSIMIF